LFNVKRYFIIYKYIKKILNKYNIQVIYNKHTFLDFLMENCLMVCSKSKDRSISLSILKMVKLDRRSCVIVVFNLFFISFIFENERSPLLLTTINTKYIRRAISTFGKLTFKLSSQSILNKNNSHDSSFLQSFWHKLTELLNCNNSLLYNIGNG